MAHDIPRFPDSLVNDSERNPESPLQPAWPDTECDGDPAGSKSVPKVVKILAQLLPTSKPPSLEERQMIIEQELKDHGYPAIKARSMALIASRSTRRSRGRPKTQGLYAIRALKRHLTINETWRTTFLVVKGPCPHVCTECHDITRRKVEGRLDQRKSPTPCAKCKLTLRPEGKRMKVCFRCAGALRAAARKLEASLRGKGVFLTPASPRRCEQAVSGRLEQTWSRLDSQQK